MYQTISNMKNKTPRRPAVERKPPAGGGFRGISGKKLKKGNILRVGRSRKNHVALDKVVGGGGEYPAELDPNCKERTIRTCKRVLDETALPIKVPSKPPEPHTPRLRGVEHTKQIFLQRNDVFGN